MRGLRSVDGHVPRQEFFDRGDGMIGDVFKDVMKIEFWIQVV
jgi:hypothetical protein